MKVLVTGGSGIVGDGAIEALRERGHHVRLLARGAEAAVAAWPDGVEACPADVSRPETLEGTAEGMEAVLHIAGIAAETPPDVTFEKVNVEGTRRLLEEAGRAGVRRFVFVSSLGADRGSSGYHRSKRRAEELVREFGGEWVIVRPGNVYGPGDEVVSVLLRLVRSSPAVPLVGAGEQPFEPIWHQDLARALAGAVERDDLAGAVLEVSGGEKTTMKDLLDRFSELEGRRPLKVPVPSTLVEVAEAVASGLGLPFPVDRTKLTLLQEENVVQGENALPGLLGGPPTPLQEGLRRLRETLPEQLPADGVGRLRRKRFGAHIAGSRLSAQGLQRRVVARLDEVMPLETEGAARRGRSLEVGDTFTVTLPLRGVLPMRVAEVRPGRITFLTLDGHALAGALQFGFEDGPHFEVRVYARPGSTVDGVGLALGGSFAQDATWRDVVERAAALAGGRVADEIEEESETVDEEEAAEVEGWVARLATARKRRERQAAPRAKRKRASAVPRRRR